MQEVAEALGSFPQGEYVPGGTGVATFLPQRYNGCVSGRPCTQDLAPIEQKTVELRARYGMMRVKEINFFVKE